MLQESEVTACCRRMRSLLVAEELGHCLLQESEVTACCRTIFAAARDNNLPEVLSYIHVEQRTPLTSMVFGVSSP